jgi:hypothetical protein
MIWGDRPRTFSTHSVIIVRHSINDTAASAVESVRFTRGIVPRQLTTVNVLWRADR